jgi:hypothetical protein
MQGILIAVIGVIGVTIPALITLASAPGRRLSRVKQDAELFAALPEQLIAERQLLRYVLSESVWQYAIARRRLFRLMPYLLGSLSGVLLMGFGAILLGYDPDLAINLEQDNRPLGFVALAYGAGIYLAALAYPVSSVRNRIRKLQGPSSRLRQLIAVEASRVDDGDLGSLPRGDPPGQGPFGSVRRALFRNVWRELDAIETRSSPGAVTAEGDDDARGQSQAPDSPTR